jgi:hypothetical protein
MEQKKKKKEREREKDKKKSVRSFVVLVEHSVTRERERRHMWLEGCRV